jgi:hypothetical protein
MKGIKMNKKLSILLIEDEEEWRYYVTDLLSDEYSLTSSPT